MGAPAPALRFGPGLRFRLGTVPVNVGASFLVVSVLMAAGRMSQPALLLEWVAVVLVSVLLHELGHAAAYRTLGFSARIELHGMGGTTYGTGERAKLTTARRVAVSLAGPGAGLLLGAGAWLAADLAGPAVSGWPPVAGQSLRDLVWVNVGWGAVNLLPVLPLDGGNAAAAVLDALTGGRGARPAMILSIATAAVGAALALWVWWPWAAFLAVLFGVNNVRALQAAAAAQHDGPWEARLAEGAAALASRDGAAAAAAGREALGHVRSAAARAQAAHLCAAGALLQGDVDAALDGLGHFPAGQLPSPPLVAATFHAVEEALFRAGRFGDAAEVGRNAFARFGGARFAYNVACSEARSGRAAAAADWLDRAVGAGWTDLAAMDADEDLASLRGRDDYERVRARLRAAGAPPI
jgi:Zn-dependent protease